MLTEVSDAAQDVEAVADQEVTRECPAMLRIVVLDVLDKIVADRLVTVDDLLSGYVDLVIGCLLYTSDAADELT